MTMSVRAWRSMYTTAAAAAAFSGSIQSNEINPVD